jgi:DNA-binding MarR family transcriptional regulator
MSSRPNPQGKRKAELDRIVETLLYLYTESRRLAREQSSRYGVTATQLNVLKLLAEIGGLSLSSLSRRIQAQNSTVSGIVDRMERDGLVLRERSLEDRRVWVIRLTEKGQRLAGEVEVTPWDTLRTALRALSAEDHDRLFGILSRLSEHVARVVARQSANQNAGQAANGGGVTR